MHVFLTQESLNCDVWDVWDMWDVWDVWVGHIRWLVCEGMSLENMKLSGNEEIMCFMTLCVSMYYMCYV